MKPCDVTQLGCFTFGWAYLFIFTWAYTYRSRDIRGYITTNQKLFVSIFMFIVAWSSSTRGLFTGLLNVHILSKFPSYLVIWPKRIYVALMKKVEKAVIAGTSFLVKLNARFPAVPLPVWSSPATTSSWCSRYALKFRRKVKWQSRSHLCPFNESDADRVFAKCVNRRPLLPFQKKERKCDVDELYLVQQLPRLWKYRPIKLNEL